MFTNEVPHVKDGFEFSVPLKIDRKFAYFSFRNPQEAHSCAKNVFDVLIVKIGATALGSELSEPKITSEVNTR